MYPDFKELLSVLNAHSVKYLVVGAYAVSIYAQPRATRDMDILVKPDAGNAEGGLCCADAVRNAAAGCNAFRLRRKRPVFRMGREPVAVDIMTEIPGVDFDAAWERRVEEIVDA